MFLLLVGVHLVCLKAGHNGAFSLPQAPCRLSGTSGSLPWGVVGWKPLDVNLASHSTHISTLALLWHLEVSWDGVPNSNPWKIHTPVGALDDFFLWWPSWIFPMGAAILFFYLFFLNLIFFMRVWKVKLVENLVGNW